MGELESTTVTEIKSPKGKEEKLQCTVSEE